MRLVPYTYNGLAINDGTNYKSYFLLENNIQLQAPTEIIDVQRPFLPPYFAIKKLTNKIIPVTIRMLGTLSTQMAELQKYFNVRDQTLRTLIIKDSADSDRQWQVSATCVAQNAVQANVLVVSLYIQDDTWETVTENSSSWSITASGQTKTITTIGNAATQPTLEITPTVGISGYTYKRFITVLNNTTSALNNYPLNVVSTSFDTAALVTAGKMQADGDDIKVIIDGVEVDRWLGNMNATATRVWVSLDFRPKIELLTVSDIPASGLSTVSIKKTTANLALLKKLPKNSLMLVDSEILLIGTPNVVTYEIPIIARAQKGTSAGAHSGLANMKWIEHDIWLIYGDASEAAPTLDNTYKPIFNLDTSTNTSWVYAAFFSEDVPTYTGSWVGSIVATSGKQSKLFTGQQDTVSDPSNTMGMSVKCWLSGAAWQAENATLAWKLYNPCGVASVAATGQKYFNITGKWPATAALQYTTDNINYSNLWNQTIPSSISTWTSFTTTATTITGSPKTIRFLFSGSLPARASGLAHFEVDTATVTFTSANVPSITVSSEQSNYNMAAKITNTTTGEYIEIKYPMYIDQTIIVNCEEKTVTLNDYSVLGAISFSSVRLDWLNLNPSANNVLQYNQTGTSGVTVVVKWQDRTL